MTTPLSPDSRWTRRRREKQRRLELVRELADGVVLPTENIVAALEALTRGGHPDALDLAEEHGGPVIGHDRRHGVAQIVVVINQKDFA